MKSDLIAAYAALTIKNTYEAPISKDDNPLTIKIGGKDFVFDRIDDSEKDTDSGYQGHIYRNPSNGDIIVVHEGSIPLGEKSRFPLEVEKDWNKANRDTLMGIVNAQFEPAEKFVDYAKSKYPNSKIIIIGQSLGGTLSQLTGALDKNKAIEIYTFNAFGAGHLLDSMAKMGKTLSNDYSNIHNLAYRNEVATKINPHIGYVFKANYIVPPPLKSPFFHSIEVHYINGPLNYELDLSYPAILRDKSPADMVKLFLTKSLPVIRLISDDILPMNAIDNFVNTIKPTTFNLEISMNNTLYSIKSGDTIWDICKRYEITQDELIKMNPWLKERFSKDNKFVLISPNEKILIPNGHINIEEETLTGYAVPTEDSNCQTNKTLFEWSEGAYNGILEETEDALVVKEDGHKTRFVKNPLGMAMAMFSMSMGSYACGVVNSYKKKTPERKTLYKLMNLSDAIEKNRNDSIINQSDKDRVNDALRFQLQQDENQTEIIQSALQQTSEQIKTDVKSEILDEISRQTMFPNREHVENIMRDVFDDVLVRRGYKKSN